MKIPSIAASRTFATLARIFHAPEVFIYFLVADEKIL